MNNEKKFKEYVSKMYGKKLDNKIYKMMKYAIFIFNLDDYKSVCIYIYIVPIFLMTATTTKRGRGRPKSTVPSSTKNQNSPEPQSEMETGKHDEIEDENKLDGEKLIEERSKEVETPKDDPKGNQEARRLWVDVISENRNPTKGRMMSYVAPKMVEGQIEIEIEDEDIESEIRYWENALILYVLGGDLNMNTIKNFMERNWNFVQLPNLYYHDDGYFLLRFKSHDDMEVVVMKGPYTIRSMPVVLKEWRTDFSLKQDMLRTIPIWIKLPKLPLYLWGERSLNKIGSAIGTPMVTDECTTHKLRVSYARMLVEVDITRKLVEEIAIKDKDGRKMMQPIEYEWRPKLDLNNNIFSFSLLDLNNIDLKL